MFPVHSRRLLGGALLACVAAVAVAFAVIAAPEHESSTNDEWVNPGAPLAPSDYIQTDWFVRGDENARSGLTPAAAAVAAQYDMAVRFNTDGPVRARTIIVQPGQLVEGEQSFDAYTFKYSDRIAIVVTPANSPVDLTQRLATEDAKTTSGDTRLWQSTTVAGFPAAFRKSAVQKWESGDQNVLPAVLEWCEPRDGTPRYITYAIMGDATLDQLQAVAAQLRHVNTK